MKQPSLEKSPIPFREWLDRAAERRQVTEEPLDETLPFDDAVYGDA